MSKMSPEERLNRLRAEAKKEISAKAQKLEYKSYAMEIAHQSMMELHQAGRVSDEQMEEFDQVCLVWPVNSSQTDVIALDELYKLLVPLTCHTTRKLLYGEIYRLKNLEKYKQVNEAREVWHANKQDLSLRESWIKALRSYNDEFKVFYARFADEKR